MLWDMIQQLHISSAKQDASNASDLAVTANISIVNIQSQLDTLVLANQAMWELLQDRFALTEKELTEKMNEIDLRDGVQDGKIKKAQVKDCRGCGRKVGQTRSNCYWCGAKLETGSPFSKF